MTTRQNKPKKSKHHPLSGRGQGEAGLPSPTLPGTCLCPLRPGLLRTVLRQFVIWGLRVVPGDTSAVPAGWKPEDLALVLRLTQTRCAHTGAQ